MDFMPLVSVCMPVYNGDKYLSQVLDSLLNQSYKNIEIIILDNISTDNTSLISQRYASHDRRVRYICDNMQVGDPEGHHRVANYANGEYILIACDDDVYEESYIEVLMEKVSTNKNVGMAFSGMGLIDEVGVKKKYELKDKYFLKAKNSIFYNFCFYLLHRSPIPLQFGLMKKELHYASLRHFHRLKPLMVDHDNLYMLKLLSLSNVDSINKPLFYYRQRVRKASCKDIPRGSLKWKVCNYIHQFNFSVYVIKIIAESDFSFIQKIFLYLFNFIVFFYQVFRSFFGRAIKMFWAIYGRLKTLNALKEDV